jgi:hypothetical protein
MAAWSLWKSDSIVWNALFHHTGSRRTGKYFSLSAFHDSPVMHVFDKSAGVELQYLVPVRKGDVFAFSRMAVTDHEQLDILILVADFQKTL